MNRAYRIVWSAARQAWIVASEKASSAGRPALTVKAMTTGLLLLSAPASVLATDYSGSTVNSGSTQTVTAGDRANKVTIDGGEQNIASGGTATSTTMINSGTQNILSGGKATDSIVNGGWQIIQGGGMATSTTVDLGSQYISSGGTATFTTLISKGNQYISSGGMATSTTVNSGGWQYVNNGGAATDTILNSGGWQNIYSGGTATDTIVDGGKQNIEGGGSATSTTLNSKGMQFISRGGIATSTTINSGGTLQAETGSTAHRVTQSAGGALVTTTQATVDGTNALGNFSISGGQANHVLLENGGSLLLMSGDFATNTTINSGGTQSILVGGTATDTILNSAGIQHIYNGGTATATSVNSGGMLKADTGSIVNHITQNIGGALITTTQATVDGSNLLGDFSISSGQASNILLENGGSLEVVSGNFATDTTVNSGGRLLIDEGGVLDGTTTLTDGAKILGNIANKGTLKFNQQNSNSWSGTLTGTGQITKQGAGELTLGGTLHQSQVNLNQGSLVMDGLQAVTDIVGQAGTSLSLVNGTVLTGTIDPTDVNINQSSTWNITGDSLVSSLTNAGNIVFSAPQGTLTTRTLTVNNLTGKGGTITLNTVAGDSHSPTDNVVIDGGRASGSTNLSVINRGGLGAQTEGNGIPVIQTIHGATTDTHAFNLSRKLVAGAYEYSLYRNTDQNWYLTTQTTSGGNTSGGNTSGGNTSGGNTSGGNTSGGNTSGGNTSGGNTSGGNTSGGNTSGGNTSGGNTPAGGDTSGHVNYRAAMSSYAATQSLSMDYDRLIAGTADTRFRYALNSRVWGRLSAGHLHHNAVGRLQGDGVPESQSNYQFFQIGGDLWQFDGENADWRAGIYGGSGLMRSDMMRDGGSESAGIDRDTVYTGGTYLSGRLDNAIHIDGLLQVSRHSVKVSSNDSTRLSTLGTGWLASLEVGQVFTLMPSLALEPQLHYTVQGLSLNEGQDEAAALNWSNSQRHSVRAGLKLGTPAQAKTKLDWWVTPSITQSYGAHSRFNVSVPGVTGSDAAFKSNLSGTSIGLNGGVNAHIRDNMTVGVQAGWSESLHGGEYGAYSGMFNLGLSF